MGGSSAIGSNIVTGAVFCANLCARRNARARVLLAHRRPRLSERSSCLLVVLAVATCQACGSGPKTDQPVESLPKAHAQASAPAQPPQKPAPSQQHAEVPAAEPAPVEEPTDVQKVLAYDPKDPLANLEAADALDKMAQRPTGATQTTKVPHGACVVLDAGRRVWPAPGPAAVAAVGRDFVVAGYAQREGREQLFVVHVTEGGLPEPIAAFDVKPPHPRARVAAPGLTARDENDLTVAFVDGAGKLWARRLRVGRGGTGAPVEIASTVDTRFAPALASSQDHTLLAWTAASTPMHTHLAVLSSEGAVISRHDVTPTGLGATAPSFVSGANPPVLVALDAHEGMSPILRIEIGNHGEPQPAQVALPVGMVSSPPELAAASSPVGTYVAYTGLGSAATSAIGIVAIAPIAGTPEALVKGTAYGPLHVAAAAAPRALVFAADAPTQAGKAPPHEIHVHVVGLHGVGPATIIHGAGDAARVALVRAEGGNYGLAFTSPAGVYLARLRCDDGG